MPHADPGLFGPASVTWQLHGDPMMWIAGVRALWLQALHPRAVRGVTQNSDFRKDARGRLLRTANFVGTTTYGTTEAAERAGAAVRGIHRRLSATDPDTGERYPVDDPALLLWVHCAEVDSYLHVVRRSGIALSDAQADAYYAEHRQSARLVGLDPADVPDTAARMAAYFEKVRPELALTPEARGVDAFLRRPPVPLPVVPVRELLWGRVASLAYAALPPHAHELYGRQAPPPHVVTRRLRAAGAVLRTVPAGLRWQLPPKHILRAVARLGPGSRPSSYNLHRRAAILDGPGEARGIDGGGGAGWRNPG
ncbi:oxygenase MpaB family protein [Streptomyces roseifaciens]|uniref:oxygenase MpaB family protein n=1 Tax=Streptomyces roseifaciens TaxID=1488406 RepID=UPI000718272E|nr:oxygenase MpaB family protein [Streptomyces roseifaciens]